jgi:hypothetical protein
MEQKALVEQLREEIAQLRAAQPLCNCDGCEFQRKNVPQQ